MSEFKYACPVCGQHIKCDSSQAGSVMECPTCFQKITVPQAPATDDQKFILTGSQVVEKKTSRMLDAGGMAAPKKRPSIAGLVIVVLILAAGAGFFFFGDGVFQLGSVAHWRTADIGGPRVPGSFRRAKGTFTVAGSGDDIWYQADSFRYVFQRVDGDCTLTARVVNIKNTDAWAKAGVMIRDSLDPGSAYAMVFVSPSSGIAFQQRDHSAGPASEVLHVPGPSAPFWIRLVRKGDTVSGFSSADGTAWTPMGSTTISLGNRAYAGLAVCSHNNETLCQAQFDNVTLQTKSKTGPAANLAPKPVAPPANDTNWMLDLGEVMIPDSAVAGRIHGQEFIIDRAVIQNGALMLRAGTRGPVEFGAFINFNGVPPEALSGRTINVTTNTGKAARVTLRWPDNGQALKTSFDNGYAMRLEFGALNRNRLPGKIYFCAPDAEKSYLMGTFKAEVRRPKARQPQ
jgi:regulation of enolase protein 1 (concanavalin A-like superfamily)/DNA-directed RNA polymerase subunit RPC12/RpoP